MWAPALPCPVGTAAKCSSSRAPRRLAGPSTPCDRKLTPHQAACNALAKCCNTSPHQPGHAAAAACTPPPRPWYLPGVAGQRCKRAGRRLKGQRRPPPPSRRCCSGCARRPWRARCLPRWPWRQLHPRLWMPGHSRQPSARTRRSWTWPGWCPAAGWRACSSSSWTSRGGPFFCAMAVQQWFDRRDKHDTALVCCGVAFQAWNSGCGGRWQGARLGHSHAAPAPHGMTPAPAVWPDPSLPHTPLSPLRETGWRVRMLTRFGNDGPTDEEIRAAWKTDDRTVVILVDPTCECRLRLRLHSCMVVTTTVTVVCERGSCSHIIRRAAKHPVSAGRNM